MLSTMAAMAFNISLSADPNGTEAWNQSAAPGAAAGNDTALPYLPGYIRYTSMVLCVVIMCLGVVGNIMVPIVIFKTKDMRNSTNIFLVNLSVADLMVLLVCTPTVLVEVNSPLETWVLGEEMCKAVPFVENTVAHASVLTILAISFERYYAICKPLKAGYVCTKTRASHICLLAWLVAAILTSPLLSIAEYKRLNGSSALTCETQANSFWPALYFLITIFLFFIVPLFVLLVIYLVIAKNLITDAANILLNKHLDNYSHRARRQVVLMLGTVVLTFFLCLIPFRVFLLWIIIVSDETVKGLGAEKYYNILYFCRIMIYLNSAINPILYNIMSSKFREAFLDCSRKRKSFHFRRARNGTFSTTTTSNSYRSSTFRQSCDSYKVSFRPSRSHSIVLKLCEDSPKSIRSADSRGKLANRDSPLVRCKASDADGHPFKHTRIDEDVEISPPKTDNGAAGVVEGSRKSSPDESIHVVRDD